MFAASHTDDVIQPRDRAVTEKIPQRDPWLTIAPDEQTVPQREPERVTYAELIRATTDSFHHGKGG